MVTAIEMFLIEHLISEATGPAAKAWVLSQLKAREVAATNPYLKLLIQGAEAFLAAQAS